MLRTLILDASASTVKIDTEEPNRAAVRMLSELPIESASKTEKPKTDFHTPEC